MGVRKTIINQYSLAYIYFLEKKTSNNNHTKKILKVSKINFINIFDVYRGDHSKAGVKY